MSELEAGKSIEQQPVGPLGSRYPEFTAHLEQITKYGENPWQESAGLYDNYSNDPLAISKFQLVEGATPSYNNYADADRMLQTITHVAAGFEGNFGVVPNIAIGAKHGNACGASITGVGTGECEAIRWMLAGDQRAIFGGSIMLNFAVGEEEANTLTRYGMDEGEKRLLDLVVAPDFTSEAIGILKRKEGRLRALANTALESLSEDSLDAGARIRHVRGGYLAQENYTFVLDLDADYIDKHDTKISRSQELDMVLAWAIGSTSNSNTITLVKNRRLIGNGTGQQDRVSAAELAVKRTKDAGHDMERAVAYSDSFFPFPDGPQVLIDAGVSAILTSSGSVNDEKVFKSITDSGVALYTVPDSAGRGFYAH